MWLGGKLAKTDEEAIRTRAHELWREAGEPASEMDKYW
jgi:DUF2934 family protein